MKNPFKRNNQADQTPAMPPELTEYYNAEKRQRTVVTWALGFATLVVTVAIAFGLFLGARWIINKVRNDDKAPEPTPTTQTTQPATENAPATTDKPASPTTGSQTQGQTSTTPTGPQTSSTVTTPNKKLPSTGPGDVVAVATVVTAAGTLLHYRRSTKRA